MVRGGGLEPPRLTTLEPKSRASTNSAIRAWSGILYWILGVRDGTQVTKTSKAPVGALSVSVWGRDQGLTVVNPTLTQSCMPPRYHLSFSVG
jgi:hypothetical protein